MQKRFFNHALWRTVLLCLFIILVACQSPTPPSISTPPTAAPQPTAQPAATTPAADGASLLEARCTACHSIDRVKQAKKTRDQWAQTVTRMFGKGAQLNAAEQSTVIDYLSKTYGQ